MKQICYGLLLMIMCVGCTAPYIEGDRTGVVVKFSKKGILWKTWEGEMQVGGAVAVTPESVFRFSVEGETMAEEIKKSLGQEVTLHYEQLPFAPPWKGSTDYYIVGIGKSGP